MSEVDDAQGGSALGSARDPEWVWLETALRTVRETTPRP